MFLSNYLLALCKYRDTESNAVEIRLGDLLPKEDKHYLLITLNKSITSLPTISGHPSIYNTTHTLPFSIQTTQKYRKAKTKILPLACLFL